jgi:hypothetical protein
MMFLTIKGSAQNPEYDTLYPSELRKGRLIGVSVTGGALYIGGMIGLYNLWYKNYPQSSFHFINDNDEWLYMDKIGHATTAYWIGRVGYNALRWSGVDEKKSIWIGGSLGFAFLTTIEIFDGFSAEWGASAGDIIANTAGAAMFIGQQFLWHDQRFSLKFSYSPSEFAQYNPELLGQNHLQRVIKDYNGQTYWLSTNIKSFFRNKNSRFPGWLNVAFGYSGMGMIGARSNPEGNIPQYERIPRFLFSLDIDLTRIKTRSDTMKLILNMIGFIKIPFPTLEYNRQNGVVYHWLYF